MLDSQPYLRTVLRSAGMLWAAIGGLVAGGSSHGFCAETLPRDAEQINSPNIDGVELFRHGNSLYVVPNSAESTTTATVPRFAAPLRSIHWQEQPAGDGISLTPEQEEWRIKWTERPPASTFMRLEFDVRPLLVDELLPIASAGDGSFFLAAHLATTEGEKVRYEPQTYKNTVGYWTGKQDAASWQFEVLEPGRFNVGILQGCGKGQGGSVAKLEFIESAAATEKVSPVEFEVVETGHFQNFQWRHVAVVDLPRAGVVTLRVSPTKINKAALMDVRAIHLVRLPQ